MRLAFARRRPQRVVVGPARHVDLRVLAELQAAAEDAERAFSPDLGTRLCDRLHARRCFKRRLFHANERTFVARVGRRPVGMMGVDLHRLNYRHYIVRRYVYLHSLIVERGWRGHGIARRLIGAGLAWARRRGATQARLEMAFGNRGARALYASFGFTPREVMFTLDLRSSR